MPRGKKLSTEKERLDWLKLRPELWKDAELQPMAGGTYRCFVSKQIHLNIVNEMKQAGLLSHSTYYLDIRIERYVRKLKGLQ